MLIVNSNFHRCPARLPNQQTKPRPNAAITPPRSKDDWPKPNPQLILEKSGKVSDFFMIEFRQKPASLIRVWPFGRGTATSAPGRAFEK
jgi:hypothetical protein